MRRERGVIASFGKACSLPVVRKNEYTERRCATRNALIGATKLRL